MVEVVDVGGGIRGEMELLGGCGGGRAVGTHFRMKL